MEKHVDEKWQEKIKVQEEKKAEKERKQAAKSGADKS
jgi:hypothetical protein